MNLSWALVYLHQISARPINLHLANVISLYEDFQVGDTKRSSDGLQNVIPTPLMDVCLADDLQTLKTLLSASEDTQEDQDSIIIPLLAEATKKGHKAIVEYLLEQTASVDFSEELLLLAVSAGLDIYKAYLAKNPKILRHEWQGLGDVVCLALVKN